MVHLRPDDFTPRRERGMGRGGAELSLLLYT